MLYGFALLTLREAADKRSYRANVDNVDFVEHNLSSADVVTFGVCVDEIGDDERRAALYAADSRNSSNWSSRSSFDIFKSCDKY